VCPAPSSAHRVASSRNNCCSVEPRLALLLRAQLLAMYSLRAIELLCRCHWVPLRARQQVSLRVTLPTVAYLPNSTGSPHHPEDAVTAFVILVSAS
jgi:hypothetical protein